MFSKGVSHVGCGTCGTCGTYCTINTQCHTCHVATALSRSRAMAANCKLRKARHYYSTYDLASTVSFGMQVSVNDSDHGRVVRIFVCLSRGLYCHRKSKRALEQWWPTARQKRLYLSHQGEFQHQLLSFRSVLDSDHGGVVRIYVGQS